MAKHGGGGLFSETTAQAFRATVTVGRQTRKSLNEREGGNCDVGELFVLLLLPKELFLPISYRAGALGRNAPAARCSTLRSRGITPDYRNLAPVAPQALVFFSSGCRGKIN